ncbi:tetratricopeptide repeat protein [Luteimonas vadosa]|uniref:Tetratricopeptide repeat protein n=1 Tax=Luteimonas vadosa TaxID=1165507 RepID=A0ABP9DU79_9GAMM
MSKHRLPPRLLLSAAVMASLLVVSSAPVFAQGSAQERAEARRAKHAAAKAETEQVAATTAEPTYPSATRQEPNGKASAKLTPRLQKLFEAYDESDLAAAQAIADEVLANPDANAYEKAIAARIIGSMHLGQDDARAQAYLQQAVDFNGLGNNEHYESMLIVAQLQMQDEKYDQSLATLEKFLAETRSTKPEHLVLKGNALYRLERYPEAIAVLKPAIDATPEPRADWTQLLMGAYAASDQPEEAARLAEKIAAGTPSDKRAQINLAATYLQSDQYDKAAEIYEKLRAAGQLTEERDYRNLYALYFNAQGKEAQVVTVINDGLQKGILKPDHATYQALAQAYFFSGQAGKAIEAYQKAAPLASDGQTYLDLAKILANEGRTAESKQAAQMALDKGVKDPEAARKLLSR